jgi:hypothetical protein
MPEVLAPHVCGEGPRRRCEAERRRPAVPSNAWWGVDAREGDKVASCSRPKGPQEPHTGQASWAQGVFVDPPIFHNHRKVLVGVFDESEIF